MPRICSSSLFGDEPLRMMSLAGLCGGGDTPNMDVGEPNIASNMLPARTREKEFEFEMASGSLRRMPAGRSPAMLSLRLKD